MLYLTTKFKQTGAKIKISSDLLENVCTSQFEGTSTMKWFWANLLPPALPLFMKS